MTAILVVDSNEAMVRALCINLRSRHYEAQGATSGREGLALAGRSHFDAVLLDVDLRDLDGLDIISGLRGWSTVPIIVVSQRASELDMIGALDAGADDYVTKPFGMGELLARLRAVLRRSRHCADEPTVTTDDFTIDLAGRQVTTETGYVALTATEWRLVEVLVRNAGRVVTREALLREVWGPSFETETQYLRVYLSQIRRKLEPDPAHPRYFFTHPGLGLRFDNGSVGEVTTGTQPARGFEDRQVSPRRLRANLVAVGS